MKQYIFALILALVALPIVACGGSAAPTTAPQPTTSPVAIAPTEDATKIINDLATSVAAIQNPKTPPTATPTAPIVSNLPDPCMLMTQTDVNAAAGLAFDATKMQKTLPEFLGAQGTPLICKYVKDNQQVSLMVYNGVRPYDTQKGLSDYQKTLQTVSGLGDSAFWDTASNSLWVWTGNLGLTLDFDRIDKVTVDTGKKLMGQALARLK